MNDIMKIRKALIVAVDNKRGFAKGNTIPWHYPADFRWFKSITNNHVCVMGRHTYEEIKAKQTTEGPLLPGRDCYVVSSTLESLPDATVVKHLGDVENILVKNEVFDKTIFTIGGERLFTEGVAMADDVYITVINKDYQCDKFFPVEYVVSRFDVKSVHRSDEAEDLRFVIYTRRPGR